ncbi:HmuY family protein [Sandaracinus amylolyticus]|uniref:HmuY family protein n=1 Tax=Sandaracinus amylolyticus TaxID=927083 RepID=UPI001F31BA6E|nr:HmuY family protein [Sandaracinus amylolyticus]UJR82042.1 Hypothetical protein I5071_41070 [Sandaracinus amylolyticus]
MKSMQIGSFLLSMLALAACGDDDGPAPTDDGGVDDAGSDAGPAPQCTAHDVRCQEASITELRLFEPSALAGLVTEEGTTAGEFTTHVDATAMPVGGTSPTTSYVYARFTETGLEQVEIGDEDALLSSGWDIAFRRYVIRLNSGISGPSCVTGARLPPTAEGEPPTFESVTEVPADLELFEEEYFTEASPGECTLVSDGSGLPGAPDTILAGYWRYSPTMCLMMTGNVYVLQLREGRHVKLEVISYYSPENQEACNSGGSPTSPSGSANMRVRWAFLD